MEKRVHFFHLYIRWDNIFEIPTLDFSVVRFLFVDFPQNTKGEAVISTVTTVKDSRDDFPELVDDLYSQL